MALTVVQTDRLRLEPWDERHTELLVGLSSLPEVMRFTGAGGIHRGGRHLAA